MRGPPGLLRNNSNCKPTIMCPLNAGPCSPHFNSSSPPHLNNSMKQGLLLFHFTDKEIEVQGDLEICLAHTDHR